MPSRAYKWIGRAALVLSFTLSILLIDEPYTHDQGTHVRRLTTSEQEEEDDKAAAQAALTALDQAMGVLDEIIAAHGANGGDAQSESHGDDSSNLQAPEEVNTGDESDADQVNSGADQEQHQTASKQQDKATAPEQQIDQEELSQEKDSDNESIKKAAAEALGEAKTSRRDPAPQPIQSREKYFGKVFPETNHVDMPFYLRNTFEPTPLKPENRDIIFYWHIPKTAGGLVKNVMGMCFGLKRGEKLKEPASLEMVHDVIVNVDTSSPEGIAEAHELGLVDSNMVDFIFSSFVLSASSLFTPQHRGRAFTILRHPIDAAASNFHARKVKHPELRGTLTLAQYASKNFYVDNWVTRQLTGTLPHETLEQRHVDQAKNILAAKFFVGIYEHMDETMRQLKAFYNWKALEGQEYCVTDLIHGANPNFQKTYRGKPARGSNDWAFVADVEKWDMELYYFALEVFSKQGRIWNAEKYSLIEMNTGGKSY